MSMVQLLFQPLLSNTWNLIAIIMWVFIVGLSYAILTEKKQ